MLTDVACIFPKCPIFISFFFFQLARRNFPHSPLLTLPTAPCSLLATTLRAPCLTSHCHSPTSPYLPLSPGTWLRTARRTPGKHAPPFFSFLLAVLWANRFCLRFAGTPIHTPPLPNPPRRMGRIFQNKTVRTINATSWNTVVFFW